MTLMERPSSLDSGTRIEFPSGPPSLNIADIRSFDSLLLFGNRKHGHVSLFRLRLARSSCACVAWLSEPGGIALRGVHCPLFRHAMSALL